MNSKIKQYINEKKRLQKARASEQLLKEGVYEMVYAPMEIVGYGKKTGDEKILKFPIRNKDTKVGDKIKIIYNNEKIEVIIDRIEYDQLGDDSEYPFRAYDSDLKINRKCKHQPVVISDEEYEEIKCYLSKETKSEKNTVSVLITAVACVIFVFGFILGCYFLGTNTSSISSFILALICWCIAGMAGTLVLGLAEIVELLNDIKNK